MRRSWSGTTRPSTAVASIPLPEPVAEIVSPTSEVRDLEDKPALYAALGIVEYLACHPGDLPDP